MPSSRGARRTTALAATAAALSWATVAPLKEVFTAVGLPSFGNRPGAAVLELPPVAPSRVAATAGATATSTGAAALATSALVAAAGLAAAASRRAARPAQRSAVAVQACSDAGASPAPAGMCFSGAAGVDSVGPVFGGAAARADGDVAMHLLMPKNVKWRKPHKPAIKPFRHCTKWAYRGEATAGNKPTFGKYAIKATEEAWISNKTIEVMRRAIVRTMERKGKIWIRIFPHQAITKRVAESRMGAGKGGIDRWVAAVRPGFILFEIDGVSEDIAREAFRKCSFKLPCQSKMVIKRDGPSLYELGRAGREKRRGVDPRLNPNFKKG